MIPKKETPTKKDLIKKHKINPYADKKVNLNYYSGDGIDEIFTDLKKIVGGTRTSILRNALFSYYLFIKQS